MAENEKNSSELSPLNLFFLGIVAGAVFIGFAIWHHCYVVDLQRNGVSVPGTVVQIDETRGRRGRISYYPVVAFVTKDGANQQAKTSESSGYQVGQNVTVIYSSTSPNTAEIEGSRAFNSIDFFAIGAVVSLCIAGFGGCKHLLGKR